MKKVLKWIAIGWTLLWVAVVGFAVAAALLYEPVADDSVLRLRFHGPLSEQELPRLAVLLGEEEMPTLRAVTESIRAAAGDERILGLVLDIEDAELSLAEIEEIEAAMAVFRQSGKWNAAYLETAGELSPGDGELALAATASEVVLSPAGEVNLAGLRLVVPFVAGTLAKLEIRPYVGKRYEYKTAPDMFTHTGFTPAHRESLQSLADDLHELLVEHLAARRQVEASAVGRWIETGPHPASAALEQRMVDRLGYWDAVVAAAEAAAGRKDCFVSLGTYAGERELHDEGPRVALIVGSGPIHRGKTDPSFDDGANMGADTVVAAFRKARAAGVRGILFRVDSPGGSYVASDLIRREVELSRQQKIPVVVSMGSVAASGGYFVGLGADRIIAAPGTLTGSIGVYGATFATRRFFERFLGVTFGIVETAPEGVALDFLDPPDARERAAFERTLDRIYADFVAKTAESRGKDPDAVHEVAQGRVWSGRAAEERGLIDELGGMEEALARLKDLAGIAEDSDVTLLELPEAEGPWALLGRLLSVRTRVPAELERTFALVRHLARDPDESLLALPWLLEARL